MSRRRKAPAAANSADPRQLATAELYERQAAEQAAGDLRRIAGTEFGRRFLRRLLVEQAGITRSVYLGGPTGRGSDPVFLEGQRNLGLELLAELQAHCPEQWLLAQAEYLEAAKRTEAAMSAAREAARDHQQENEYDD